MWHALWGGVEAVERAVGAEAGDARAVEAGVVLDLLAEDGLLVAFVEDEAPEGVEVAIDLDVEVAELLYELFAEASEVLDLSFDVVSSGGDVLVEGALGFDLLEALEEGVAAALEVAQEVELGAGAAESEVELLAL